MLPTQHYQTETMNGDNKTYEINEVMLLHAQRHKARTENEGIRAKNNVINYISLRNKLKHFTPTFSEL